MTTTSLEQTGLSPIFDLREAHLAEVREVLLSFGNRLNLFAEWICPCGQDDCNGRHPETFPVEQLMAAILTHWDAERYPEQEAADPDGSLTEQLRLAVLAFGRSDSFDILVCDCGEPTCPKLRADTLTAGELLDLVWLEWMGRSGNYQHMPTQAEIDHVGRLKERNLRLVDALLERIVQVPFADWEGLVRRHRYARTTAWYREARHLLDHGREIWMRDITEHPTLKRALVVSLVVPNRAGYSDSEAAPLMLGLRDAFHALLMLDIAHEQVGQALYDALEPLIPLQELQGMIAVGTSHPLK